MLFIMIQHPPGSLLFSYTTLFRSNRTAAFSACRAGQRLWSQGEPDAACGTNSGRCTGEHPGHLNWLIEKLDQSQRDRKSTRLNSSHLGISYAVFCLKKKNTKRQSESLWLPPPCARSLRNRARKSDSATLPSLLLRRCGLGAVQREGSRLRTPAGEWH